MRAAFAELVAPRILIQDIQVTGAELRRGPDSFADPPTRLVRGSSSTLLGRVVEGTLTDMASAGHDDQKSLQFPQNRVHAQAGASTFGSSRSKVQKAWARTVSVT